VVSGRKRVDRFSQGPDLAVGGFVRSVTLWREDIPSFSKYPFSIPAVRNLSSLELHPKVTYLIGENGSGKSTLIEGIAVATGFNAEGGSKNFSFSTRSSESILSDHLRCSRNIRRERTGYFLRAESYYNVATEIEKLDVDEEGIDAGPHIIESFGGVSLHEQSHGESFLALANHRFGQDGFYILDEPEAALSPTRQLSLLQIIHRLVSRQGSQFIIATHSPILMAYPDATIYSLSADGIEKVAYEETEHYTLTRDFLNHRDVYMRALMEQALVGYGD
jgi:predicted ATPase